MLLFQVGISFTPLQFVGTLQVKNRGAILKSQVSGWNISYHVLSLTVYLFFFWFLFPRRWRKQGRGGESRLKTVIQHTSTKNLLNSAQQLYWLLLQFHRVPKGSLCLAIWGLAFRGAQYRVTKWCMCSQPGGSDKSQGTVCCTEVSDAVVLPAWFLYKFFQIYESCYYEGKKKIRTLQVMHFICVSVALNYILLEVTNTQAPVYVYNKPFNRSFSILTFSPHLRLSKQKFRCESPGPKLH